MNIEIAEPHEGDTWAGYYDVSVYDSGELVSEFHLAADVVDEQGIDAPTYLRNMAAGFEAVAGLQDLAEGSP